MRTVPLGDVATIERSGVDPAVLDRDTPYLGLEHIESGGPIREYSSIGRAGLTSTKFRFDERQVLFGKLRPNLGKIARPDRAGVCSTDILPITPSARLDRGYLAHYLSQPSMVAFAASRTSGANLPRLSPGVLATFEVPLPDIEEQRRIAAILDKANAIRAKRRQVLAHLDALTQSIFHGVIACVSPDRTSFERLESFVDAGDRMNYGVVQPGEDVAAGVALVRVGDLADGRVDRRNLKRVSAEVEAPYARSRLKGNEILVSCVGSIGTVSLASAVDAGSNIARAITRIPISDEVTRKYVAAVLRSEASQRYFRAELRTVAQPTLNVRQLAATPIPVLTRDAQVALVTRLDRISAARELTSKEVVVHEGLFASLRSRAFKGAL